MTVQFGRENLWELQRCRPARMAGHQRHWRLCLRVYCRGAQSPLPRAAGGGSLTLPWRERCCWQRLTKQVDYGGQRCELSCDRWADGAIQPEGYRFIEQFRLEGTVPVWTFACGDALLEKRIWMAQGENTTYLQYRVVRASQPLSLSLKAFFNYRDHHGNTQASDWQMQIRHHPNGVEVRAFEGAVPVYVLANPAQVSLAHTWYRGYTLATEQYRGIFPHDDHSPRGHLRGGVQRWSVFHPGGGCTSATPTLDGHVALTRQHVHEQNLLDCWHRGTGYHAALPRWGRSTRTGGGSICGGSGPLRIFPGKTIIAGYPWFGDWGRDTNDCPARADHCHRSDRHCPAYPADLRPIPQPGNAAESLSGNGRNPRVQHGRRHTLGTLRQFATITTPPRMTSYWPKSCRPWWR